MKRLTRLVVATLALAGPAAVRAEVSVVVNPEGHVVRIFQELSPSDLAWEKFSALPDSQALNPAGDLLGDHNPTASIIAMPMDDPVSLRSREASRADRLRTALVAWSRLDGDDRDIVFSMWSPRRGVWRDVAAVDPAGNDLDDVDPRIYVRGRRVYLVWRTVHADGSDLRLSTGLLTESSDEYVLEWTPPITIEADTVFHEGTESFHLPLPLLLGTGVGRYERDAGSLER